MSPIYIILVFCNSGSKYYQSHFFIINILNLTTKMMKT